MEYSAPENQLKERTFKFSVGVLKFLRSQRYSRENDILKGQLLRSATSIGANYEEAQGAFSKDDFKYKISICYKESRETHYWLRILKECAENDGMREGVDVLLKESMELKRIFAAISKKLNYRKYESKMKDKEKRKGKEN